ncbi:MAG: hypothetical protein [Bacteriophage sp.]|nr:MAG: hypothetical protein [Bacteriophage sp.]
MKITSIPALLAEHYGGKVRAMCIGTGFSELTIRKYKHDVNNENHAIINGRLMVAHRNSRPIE